MRRFLSILLAAFCFVSLLAPMVRAEETEPDTPESGKAAGRELLQELCTGFPYVGYEKYPEVPQYFQQDYEHVPYGGPTGNVATHGCGITTLAMLATYMTDTELDPEAMAKQFYRYSSSQGTAFNLFDESPRALGYYFEGRTASWDDVEAALKNGQKVVSLQFADHFTTTAHFIVLYGMTEDGKVLIKDSNVFNHTKRFAGTDYYEKGFEPSYVHRFNRIYWIYEKKVVRVPGCDRCGDPEVQTVPICQAPHYCTKCALLLEKQDTFRTMVATVHNISVQ